MLGMVYAGVCMNNGFLPHPNIHVTLSMSMILWPKSDTPRPQYAYSTTPT